MENELEQYENQNAKLFTAFSSAEKELTTLFDAETVKVDEKTMTFTFRTQWVLPSIHLQFGSFTIHY